MCIQDIAASYSCLTYKSSYGWQVIQDYNYNVLMAMEGRYIFQLTPWTCQWNYHCPFENGPTLCLWFDNQSLICSNSPSLEGPCLTS